ncbi:class II myosin [Naganishia friedmannii]|uniref:Class II myosin n=1 Tax=Naganishia friedmannii TaxID=89922 RepID=A0ACC2V0H4_9TREE|nr:class II myosin [Naganishia friedmannii]
MAISKKAGKRAGGASASLPVANGGGKSGAGGKFAKADWKEGFKKKQVGVSDMTLLSTISNESINENLKKRFQNGEIYTYIAHVLISVNPFRDLGIYAPDILASYRGKNRLEMPPHVFAIAEASYYSMNSNKENQCVIISGESGAGKTEAAKRIMQYIAAVSAAPGGGAGEGIEGIREMVLATNPLLESFGCAKTLRNDNSSRHGKYLEIMFNSQGQPVGAQITNYLLEKNRVVGQIQGERDFHIFYQFTKGASAAHREMFGLQGPDAYVYTSRSGTLNVSSIDDVKDWAETLHAMKVVGMTDAEQTSILRVLATILWLGNVTFAEGSDGNAVVADTDVTDFVAYLMEAQPDKVVKVLTTRIMETSRGGRRGSIYEVPLNISQATAGRDALAKALYNNLFEWIVSRVNVSMKPQAQAQHVIGVLDIYGFEIFQDNSFEQLCINYVNEKLQQIFIELTLKTEQEEYVREQIKWTPIKYFDNAVVCALIEDKRPAGIFATLNDATATAHADPSAADNSFIQRASMLSSNPNFEMRGQKFVIKHYAGDVTYNVPGMTEKNKDALIKDILDLVESSKDPFLHTLFPDKIDPDSKKRPPTAGDKIKASANALVENLMRAEPSYIRTIKPNQNRSPTEYDDKAILHQIKYLGLQENIRVRRAGFAYRAEFSKMIQRFYLLSPATSYAGDYIWTGDDRSGCERMLRDTGIAKEEWQMGVTKAFIKNPETLFALETMRDKYWHNMAARIQRCWRSYWRFKNEQATKIQRFWKNQKEGLVYARKRDYGHQVLGGRKQRRRFSLLGMRKFMGDYLDVGGRSAQGELLRNAAGISAAETVHFSSRIEILVSKFGRTSKLSPRFLIVTDKGAHIVVSTMKDGRLATMLERKIPLVSIRSVSLSSMRDDWMAFNVNVCEEGDPIITCTFKTELVSVLLTLSNASIGVNIGPTIEYNKKKDKKANIKFVLDPSSRTDDQYKSGTVHVGPGEPATSVSRPMPARKPRPKTVKKTTASTARSQVRPTARTLPGASKPAPPAILGSGAGVSAPRSSTIASAGSAAGAAVKPNGMAKPSIPASFGGGGGARAPPPPPPPPPVAAGPAKDMHKAIYNFKGQEGELSLIKGELIEVKQKDDNGWWLCVRENGREEGWAPSNYLKALPRPKPVAAAPPPPPPPPPSTPLAPALPINNIRSAASTPPSSGASTPLRGAGASGKSAPPAVKPKPMIPPKIPSKPAAPSAGGRDIPLPAAAAAAPPASMGMGQLDLAAALRKRMAGQ